MKLSKKKKEIIVHCTTNMNPSYHFYRPHTIWMPATESLLTNPKYLEWAVKSNLPIIPCLSYRVGYVNGKLVEKELAFKNKHYTKKAPTLADLFGAASLDA